MRKTLNWTTGLLTAMAITAGATVWSQDAPPQMDVSVLEPGPHHEYLDVITGEWEHVYTLWQAPGAEPITFTGTSSAEWILDGRFIRTLSRYDAMGTEIQEEVTTGYDNFRQQYVMTHVSSWGTGVTTAIGQRKEDTKTITWEGKQDIPHIGQRDMPFKIIDTIVDEDHFRMEFLYQLEPGGEWFKQLVIESTRAE